MPLKIIVVGAGIAGLAAAVGLARHGHEVHVFERRMNSRREHSSGIQLQPNVSRILREWGMLENLRKVSHDNESAIIRDQDGAAILTRKYRGHAWYVLRGMLRNLFWDHAIEAGAKVTEGVTVAKIDVARPAITLNDGTTIECDLLIGADGSWSAVRQTLFPDFKPKIFDKACWQAALPLDVVREDAVLRDLLMNHHSTITLSPARSIFSSPAPRQNRYEFHMVDHEFSRAQDPNPELMNGMVQDLTWLRQRFSDHSPALREALARTQEALKWRFVEVTDVPSLSSYNGKVVLIGDACHSMMPFSGQGSAMGVEDAAVLSELLADASAGEDLAPRMAAFAQIRKPRFERCIDLARNNEAIFGLKDPEIIQARNELLRSSDPSYDDVVADSEASFGTPAFQIWLDDYDVFAAVREHLARVSSRLAKL